MKLSKLARRRILRITLVAIGTGLASAGALLVAGAPPVAVWVSAFGAALTAAATGINLGDFSGAESSAQAAQARTAAARAARPGSPPPPGEPMGLARTGLLVLLAVVGLGVAVALSGCGPAAEGPGTPPTYDGAVAPGGAVSLAQLVAEPSGGLPVTWSVDAGGGSITQAGVYTAPGCAELLAALGDEDLSRLGAISGADVVRASWNGGEVAITVRLQEAVLGLEVLPTEVDVEPGGQVQFRAVVHFTCHDLGV